MIHFIGDIHGHAGLLEKLLLKLGYEKRGRGFRHSEALAIFTGDYIDRGEENIRSLEIVRSMVDNGAAMAVPGNHDFMFAIYSTPNSGTGKQASPHLEALFANTLKEFRGRDNLRAEYVSFIKSLPLTIEAGDYRVVHACWHTGAIEFLRRVTKGTFILDDSQWLRLEDRKGDLYKNADFLVSGITVPIRLPGFGAYKLRLKWWMNPIGMKIGQSTFLHTDERLQQLADIPLPPEWTESFRPYGAEEKLVVHGHYCLPGEMGMQTQNIAIVDYCVIKRKFLVAGIWDGLKMEFAGVGD